MIKWILGIILGMLALSVNAQPVITAPAFTPVPGDAYYSYYYNIPPEAGPSSVYAAWDYYTLPIPAQMDTLTYSEASVLPEHTEFPGCNLIRTKRGVDTLYHFFKTSSADLSKLGFWSADYSTTLYHYFDNNYRDLVFPMTLGYSYADTTSINECDTTSLIRQVTYDSWGTLILPFGTYPNTARVTTITVDSQYCAWSGSTMVPYVYADTVINYYSPDYHYPVATMYFINNGAKFMYFNKNFIPPTTTGIASQTQLHTIYPTPAADRLFISVSSDPHTAQLYNAVGTLCLSADVSANTPINVQNLAPGIYMLKLQNQKTSYTSVHKVLIAR